MAFFRVFLKEPIYENILLYSINSEEALEFEPKPERYLGSWPKAAELPAGQYFVTQIRKEQVENSELIALAAELQKEGLWERHKLGNKLYVRKFFEDGFPVFQLWRQII